MTFRTLLIRCVIGALLATLPFALCWGIAEVMVRIGIEMAQPPEYLAHKRRSIAGVTFIIGFAMSAVAWFGLVMYALAKLLEIGPRMRHERRLSAMRERGEIDF